MAVKNATATISIVFTTVNDPVEFGLIPTLARPGGNLTGLATTPGTELNGKRLEVLRDSLLPTILLKMNRIVGVMCPLADRSTML